MENRVFLDSSCATCRRVLPDMVIVSTPKRVSVWVFNQATDKVPNLAPILEHLQAINHHNNYMLVAESKGAASDEPYKAV